MRLLPVALLLLTGVAAAQKPRPAAPATPPVRRTDPNPQTTGLAGLPGPRLSLREIAFVDGRREHIDRIDGVYSGPNGRLAVAISYNTLGVYDSLGRRLYRVEVANSDGRSVASREIAYISGPVGWRGDEMWIVDRRYSQIAIMDRSAVASSLEIPDLVRPSWDKRNTLPVFGGVDVRAVFADGSMLVVPFNPHTLMSGKGYDSTATYVLRVSESGLVQNVVTKFPSFGLADRASTDRTIRRQEVAAAPIVVAPRDFWPRLGISSDGARVVVVSVDTTHRGMDTVTVDVHNDRGQPVFTRKFGVPAVTFTQEQIDSLALIRFPRATPSERVRLSRTLPSRFPTVRDMTIGSDHSVWITLRNERGVRPVVGFNDAGAPIGTTYLPDQFQVVAGGKSALWIVNARFTPKDIVRLSLVPGPR